MSDWYVLDGHTPVKAPDMLTGARWFRTADRVVAATKLDGCTVSTVFLGLDHSWGDGPPLLFETLVFEGPLDGEMDRYPTWEAAEAGHAAMVERVRAALAAPAAAPGAGSVE